MSDLDDISSLFNSILKELKEHESPSQSNLIVGGYGLLIASVTPETGLNNPFIKQSLETALYLARLGFQGEHIACSLLYFPYLEGFVTKDQLNWKFGTSITVTMETLFTLATFFEAYLPWIKAAIKPATRDKSLSGYKKIFWENRITEQYPYVFLAISQNPETAILKIVERLFLLKNINRFSVKNEMEKRLAQDTINIFAPVAEMLGAWELKSQIEDLAFRSLQPELHHKIEIDLQEQLQERQARLQRAIVHVDRILKNDGLQANLSGLSTSQT
jgi:GTP pyrophosphokinase